MWYILYLARLLCTKSITAAAFCDSVAAIKLGYKEFKPNQKLTVKVLKECCGMVDLETCMFVSMGAALEGTMRPVVVMLRE